MSWETHPIFGRDLPAGDPEQYVFRYVSLEQASAVALTRGLVLGPLRYMNDPNEAAPEQIVTVTMSSNPSRPGRQVSDDERQAAERWLDDRRRSTPIVSFTADEFRGGDGTAARADGRGFARQGMWAHYGRNSTGVCMVFDRQHLEARVQRQWGSEARFGPIKYRPGFIEGQMRRSVVNFDQLDLEQHHRTHTVPSMFVKNLDWAAEREYRIALLDPELDPLLNVEDSLCGLVLGLHFPVHQIPVAVAIAESFGVTANAAHAYFDSGVVVVAPWKSEAGRYSLYDDDERRSGAWLRKS